MCVSKESIPQSFARKGLTSPQDEDSTLLDNGTSLYSASHFLVRSTRIVVLEHGFVQILSSDFGKISQDFPNKGKSPKKVSPLTNHDSAQFHPLVLTSDLLLETESFCSSLVKLYRGSWV